MIDNSIIFLGSKRAGLRACQTIVKNIQKGELRAIISLNDSDDFRSEVAEFSRLARVNSIPFHMVNSTAEIKELTKNISPKFAIVHGWYKILPVWEMPDTIFLGFHYSPLPKYRGHAPLVWQIINGETRLAVSFFQLTNSMDEGDLLDQRFFSLSTKEDIEDALNKADYLTEEILLDFLSDLQFETLKLSKQSNLGASYCGLRTPEDGKIDWHRSAEEIHNFIRAQGKPYPGAFTFLPDGQKLTIWKSELEDRKFFGAPGSIAGLMHDYVVVACGKDAIRVKKCSLNDGDEKFSCDILKSFKIRLS